MIHLLARWLIKDSQNYSDPRVRTAYGVLCGAAGIFLNLVLFSGKLLAGTLSGSIAITADAFNNLSDAGSSVITLLGFKLAARKPDREHPFGFGRVEYLSGLAVSAIILLMGVELLKTSVRKIITPEPTSFSVLGAVILVASILIKLYMAFYNRRVGRLVRSEAMRATSTDSLSDAVSTSVVLAAMILSLLTSFNVDAWSGLAVSLMIICAGFGAARDTINPLLGQPPEPELIERIEKIVLSYPGILGIHDLIVHDYGPGRRYVSLHAEVPSAGDVMEMHDQIDLIERRLRDECDCEPIIHMDPIASDDTQVGAMREQVAALIEARWNGQVRIHDFRMVTGPSHTNLIFDAVVPQGFEMTDAQVKKEIERLAGTLPGHCFAVVKIDKPYV